MFLSGLSRNKYFPIGLAVFYLLQFFSPNKIVYFSSYGVAVFFFYLSTRNLKTSLLYSLVLSLFTEMGLAQSWFQMQPLGLDLGSGWKISPMTILIISFLPFSLIGIRKRFHSSDLILFIFFILTFTSLIFFPYANTFLGFISVGELILLYIILCLHIQKKDLHDVSLLIISMLLFQTVTGLIQLVLRHPIGIVAESSSLFVNPYGITAPEDPNLYRLAGTFGHPNLFASFLLVTTPFLFLWKDKSKILNIFLLLSFIVMFFTYTRAAWIFLPLIILYIIFSQKTKLKVNMKILKNIVTFFLEAVTVLLVLFPYFSDRIATFSQAFARGGSMDTRFLLWQEGLNLITQYPLTGVGLNRSLQEYAANPVTDVFTLKNASGFYRIHNMFLEIGSEAGLPAMILFILFLYAVAKNYFSGKKDYPKNAAFYGLLGLIGMSMLNPFLYSSQFRLYFLLAAIILA